MVGYHVDSFECQESNSSIKEVLQSSRKTSKNYSLKSDLSDYKASKDSITTSKKYKSYQCGNCRKIFSQKNYYQNHLRSHGNNNGSPYSCNVCGKSFSVPARLTRHFRTHTGEKPYQCEYCKKSFSVKENLSVHRRIHTKERPYKCNICESAFEHSGKLHRHMRIHTGERPHKCSICNKTFIQSGQLVIHMRTHTGEKPYVCKTCSKGFTCSKQLKVHMRTHTGEKPYRCDICDKSFGYNHVLKLHQVAHYGEKFYKCTICCETFSTKKSMEFHIRTHPDSSTVIMKNSEVLFEKTQIVDKFDDTGKPKNSSEIKESEKTSSSKPVKSVVDKFVYEYPEALMCLNSKSNNEANDNLLNIHSCIHLKESENFITETKNCHNIGLKNEISTDQYFFTDFHSNDNCKDKNRQKSLICNLQQNIEVNVKTLEAPNEQSHLQDCFNFTSKLNQNTDMQEIPGKILKLTSDIKNNVCLPPRKRSKMILESMEIEQSNLTINRRLNSVIRFARTEKF